MGLGVQGPRRPGHLLGKVWNLARRTPISLGSRNPSFEDPLDMGVSENRGP